VADREQGDGRAGVGEESQRARVQIAVIALLIGLAEIAQRDE
jgi:hypothetical protein